MRDRCRHGAAAMAAVAGLVAALAGGCASIPSAGTPQSTPTPAAGGGDGRALGFVPIMRPSQPGWYPTTVVLAFLTASAFLRDNYALARQYLTPGASQSWKPGTTVTILADNPSVTSGRQGVTGEGGSTVTDVVTGQKIATLESTGQYVPAPAGVQEQEDFSLQQVGGRYLINGLPSGTPQHPSNAVLLTSSLFHLVYTPRNLYYVARRNGSLVPDPVFVPLQSTDPATQLIDDLRHAPTGWLHQAAGTAFPRGTPPPRISAFPGPSGSKIAVVDLRLPTPVSAEERQNVASQLVATLTTPAYSAPLFQAVKVKINGRLFTYDGSGLLGPDNLPRAIPHWRGSPALYYLTSSGSPRILGKLAPQGVPLPGARAGLSQIAVSPDGMYLAGIAPPGTTVYTSTLGSGGTHTSGHASAVNLRAQLSGPAITGMSWDAQDDLWLAGRLRHSSGLWVLPGGRAPPLPVRLPAHAGPVTGVRVAPDGVRVAMIVGTGLSAHLVLGAIVRAGGGYAIPHVVQLGPGLTGVTALTWYDEDHLLAVIQQEPVHQTQTSLWEVPANGDSGKSLGPQNGMMSVTAAGSQSPLYLSFSSGKVEKSLGIGEPWTVITAGSHATYPG